MRAVLVVNPKATTTSERSRDVLVRALRSQVELTVQYTRRRGHATELARAATQQQGVDVVVALGGDGTVNEVVNGMMTADPPTTADPTLPLAERLPALAVVPGGSTNVFARALGLPAQWPEGTSLILEALRLGRFRTIGLGLVNDRYFTFCAGFGLDAAVIDRVEQARRRGQVSTPALYLRSAMKQYLSGPERRHSTISVERPGEPPVRELATVIVQNTAPWTYLGTRPVNPNPDASFDLGLDLMALRRLTALSAARTAVQILSRQPNPHGRQVFRLHDLAEFTLVSPLPQPFQLDGDYLGRRKKLRFASVPRTLRVIC